MPRTDGVSSTDRVANSTQTQTRDTGLVLFQTAVDAAHLRDFDHCFTHQSLPTTQLRISSTLRPRRAATSSGELISRSPLKVACTTLTGLVEP